MAQEESILDFVMHDGNGYTEKQKKILIAAIEAFSEKGYAATSTSEIAKKAGVAEGTIFRHYKTKKDLLLSIVAPMIGHLIAPFVIKDLNKILDHHYEKYEDFLRSMVKNRLLFLQNNMSLFKILIQEIPFHEELKEQFKEHIAHIVLEKFLKLVAFYQEKGQIIDIPSYSVIRLTITSIFGYFIARYVLLPEADWDDDAEIERTIQFILYGLTPRE